MGFFRHYWFGEQQKPVPEQTKTGSQLGSTSPGFWIALAILVLVFVGLVAVLLNTLGLGFPESDEVKIEKTVENYYFAAAERDGKTACSLLFDEFDLIDETDCVMEYGDDYALTRPDSVLRNAEMGLPRVRLTLGV